jgi:histidyl-tRNA synthetase
MKAGYLGVSLVAGIIIYLLATTPNGAGALYRVPIAQARQSLAKAEMPPVFGSQELNVQVRNSDSQVVWVVSRKAEGEIFRYIAELKAEGEATRVKVKLETVNYAKQMADHAQIRDMYIVAMEERVAATLERRPFDMARIHPALSAAMVSNLSNVQASIDEVHAAEQKRSRNTIEKAYRDEATGVRR